MSNRTRYTELKIDSPYSSGGEMNDWVAEKANSAHRQYVLGRAQGKTEEEFSSLPLDKQQALIDEATTEWKKDGYVVLQRGGGGKAALTPEEQFIQTRLLERAKAAYKELKMPLPKLRFKDGEEPTEEEKVARDRFNLFLKTLRQNQEFKAEVAEEWEKEQERMKRILGTLQSL